MEINNEPKIIKLYPAIQEPIRELMAKIAEEGIAGGILAGLRTYDEQNELYEQGRYAGGDIVTNARGGESFHNFGLAIDYVFKTPKGNWTWVGPYGKVVEIVRKMGFETGADFPSRDMPHIQMSYGIDIKKLAHIYESQIISGAPLHKVWAYINEVKRG